MKALTAAPTISSSSAIAMWWREKNPNQSFKHMRNRLESKRFEGNKYRFVQRITILASNLRHFVEPTTADQARSVTKICRNKNFNHSLPRDAQNDDAMDISSYYTRFCWLRVCRRPKTEEKNMDDLGQVIFCVVFSSRPGTVFFWLTCGAKCWWPGTRLFFFA